MQIEPLSLSSIDESPTNPRKFFDPVKLSELAASIREKGVEQPIKVRPKGKRFELVFGARRLRASKEAGLKEIPGIVEELTDVEVLEAQIIENGQRADVHPLEECDAYVALHDVHKRTVPEIAAKVGKSTSYVYQRMAYRNLGTEGRKAFGEGAIDAGTALVLARVLDPDTQKKATAEVLRGWNGTPLRAREAAQLVHERYMLRMTGAPFDPKSAELVPAAGPCTTCPKRTTNARELFADIAKEDLCTDGACYAKKSDASWTLTRKRAEEKGAKILSATDTKKVFPYGGQVAYGSGYVELDAIDHGDTKGRTYRQQIGKDATKSLPVVIARDPNGKVRELVEIKEVKKTCNAAGKPMLPSLETRGSSESGSAEKKAKEAAKQGKEHRVAVITALIDKANKDGSSPAFWRTMARGALEIALSDTLSAIVSRRGLDADGSKATKQGALSKVIEDAMSKGDERTCALFVLEVLITQGSLYTYSDKLPTRIQRAAEDLGVDLKKIRVEMIAARAEKTNANAKAKSKKR